jgi:nicotinate-nucleotide--dimethylbenzimidazole phosphoribosyltransferase
MNLLIEKVSYGLINEINGKIDSKTKPAGSLGFIEELAKKISLIQNTLTPELRKPYILIFAGDHGVAAEGVSKYPSGVTYQMVLNFLQGGAAINVFSRQNDIKLKIIDAGVNGSFENNSRLVNCKIANGTKNFSKEPAMTRKQCLEALSKGAEVMRKVNDEGCNIVGLGEMGIGNTSAASAIIHILSKIPLDVIVGRGTGLDDRQLEKKLEIIGKAVSLHKNIDDPIAVLATFGGFEIVEMCGAILAAAERKMIILIDGFIASAALLAASRLEMNVIDYCVFCHESAENGHKRVISYFGARPVLNLDMRLGEGTGAALAYPIVLAAAKFMNEMASFESAGISGSQR